MNGVRTMMMVSFIDNSCRRHDIGAAGSGAFSSPAFSAISKPTTPQTQVTTPRLHSADCKQAWLAVSRFLFDVNCKQRKRAIDTRTWLSATKVNKCAKTLPNTYVLGCISRIMQVYTHKPTMHASIQLTVNIEQPCPTSRIPGCGRSLVT